MLAYRATNTVNGKVYIGITASKSLANRKSAHKMDATERNSQQAFHRAIRKYGFEAFEWEVIACATCREELVELERLLIAQHGSYVHGENHGYNMTLGGDGGFGQKKSPETLAKLKENLRAMWQRDGHRENVLPKLRAYFNSDEYKTEKSAQMKKKWADPEFREKTRAAMRKGNQQPERLARRAENTRKRAIERAKITSAIMKAQWADPEIKKRRSEAISAGQATPEAKKKRSELMLLKWSDPEYKKKISEKIAKNRPKYSVEIDGVLYETVRDAASSIGVSMSAIYQRIGKGNARKIERRQ